MEYSFCLKSKCPTLMLILFKETLKVCDARQVERELNEREEADKRGEKEENQRGRRENLRYKTIPYSIQVCLTDHNTKPLNSKPKLR